MGSFATGGYWAIPVPTNPQPCACVALLVARRGLPHSDIATHAAALSPELWSSPGVVGGVGGPPLSVGATPGGDKAHLGTSSSADCTLGLVDALSRGQDQLRQSLEGLHLDRVFYMVAACFMACILAATVPLHLPQVGRCLDGRLRLHWAVGLFQSVSDSLRRVHE